jgi:hypothetical protein
MISKVQHFERKGSYFLRTFRNLHHPPSELYLACLIAHNTVPKRFRPWFRRFASK